MLECSADLLDEIIMKPVAIFRHSPGEGPGYFATFLDRHSVPWQLVCIDEGAGVPTAPDSYSGLAFMGGPMSVNDPLPWVTDELALIRAAVAQGIPVLGHCLGGQLIAKALGAVVTKNPQKEIGWGAVQVLDSAEAREWFGNLTNFISFHWHGETFGLPSGATHILESPHCAHQAFAIGPHLGMQCHVEMTEEMIEEWGRIGAGEISANPCATVQQADEMLAGITQHLAPLHAAAERLYTRWLAGLER